LEDGWKLDFGVVEWILGAGEALLEVGTWWDEGVWICFVVDFEEGNWEVGVEFGVDFWLDFEKYFL